jgi:hypothetical protein
MPASASNNSARINLGKEEARTTTSGNFSEQSRGFDSLPAKANPQPEASLARGWVTVLVEA